MNLSTERLAISDPLLRAYEYKKQGIATGFTRPFDKKPATRWGKYMRTAPTVAEISHDFWRLEKIYGKDELGVLVINGQKIGNKYLNVLDCDSAEQTEKRKIELANTLQIQSSPDKLHAYFLTDRPIATRNFSGESLDLKAYGSYVRGPYTLRADGSRYIPINNKPIQVIEKIEGLEFSDTPVLQKNPSTFVWKVLSGNYKIVGRGNKKKSREFPTRSEAEYSAVLNMAERGFSFEEIKHFFEHYAHKHSKFRKFDKKDDKPDKNGNYTPAPDNYLHNAYDKALAYQDKIKSREALISGLDHLIIYSQSLKWDWRGGTTDSTVYSIFLRKAQSLFKLEDIGLSLDEIAIDASISKQGAAKAVKRLISYNLIEKQLSSTWNYATKWKLNTNLKYLVSERIKKGKRYYRNCISVDSYHHTHHLRDKGELKSNQHVLDWRAANLFASKFGNTLYRVCAELHLSGAARKIDLTRATGISWKSLTKGLNLLCEYGLAVKDEHKSYTLISTDFDTNLTAELNKEVKIERKKNLEIRRLDRYYQARLQHLKYRGTLVCNLITGEVLN